MIYKLLPKIEGESQVVARIDDDGLCRLTCSENDQAYLAWLDEGNTPEPAEEVQGETT
jgi:hypothetical protein